jgi:hypothetical protein
MLMTRCLGGLELLKYGEIKITNKLLEYESNELKCYAYQSSGAMIEIEFKNKTSYENLSKRKLEKDLENASYKAQADAKAWISLRRLANQ